MPIKYLAFDIETAKEVTGDGFNWRPHRPLGISCAAVYPVDSAEPIVWHGKSPDGIPTRKMTKVEASQVVQELLNYVANGYTVLTWNGLSFDFDILAEESELLSECRELALGHVDMMFHVFCDRGFPVKLIKAAEALGVQGKPAGMSGVQAPTLWAQGEHRKVLDYVAHDVRIALEIGQRCEAQKRFDWITQKGKRSSLNLNRGWLCVRDALRLPEPDTDWMDDPIPRRSFTRLID